MSSKYIETICIEKEFKTEVWCSCGNGLCVSSKFEITDDTICVTVEPCEVCLKKSYYNGYEDNGDTRNV